MGSLLPLDYFSRFTTYLHDNVVGAHSCDECVTYVHASAVDNNLHHVHGLSPDGHVEAERMDRQTDHLHIDSAGIVHSYNHTDYNHVTYNNLHSQHMQNVRDHGHDHDSERDGVDRGCVEH